MEFTSVTVFGDHRRSAMGAIRGHIRESMISGDTYSPLASLAAKNFLLVCVGETCGAIAVWIYRVVIPGGRHQVEVIAEREQAAITLLGCVAERFLPAPGLDDDALRQVGPENLVPAFHGLSVFRDDLLHTHVKVGL